MPGAFSRSTPRIASRKSVTEIVEEPVTAPGICQNGTFLEFHSAATSANGLRLRTSRSSRLPWLEEGALNFRVTPGPQVCGILSLASRGNDNKPDAKHRTPFRTRRTGNVRSNFRLPALAAACSHELPLSRNERGPAWNHKLLFPKAKTDRGFSLFRGFPSRRGGPWRT